MEIIDTAPVLLSNAEVLACLNTSSTASTTKKRLPQNVLTIDFEVSQYLQPTTTSPTVLPDMLTELAKWPLTRAERLQLVNLMPRTVVEFHAIVEECEERFTGEQIETILGIFKVN